VHTGTYYSKDIDITKFKGLNYPFGIVEVHG